MYARYSAGGVAVAILKVPAGQLPAIEGARPAEDEAESPLHAADAQVDDRRDLLVGAGFGDEFDDRLVDG